MSRKRNAETVAQVNRKEESTFNKYSQIRWTYRVNQMHNHVHHNECDEYPVHPLGQFGFGQFYSEEYRNDCKQRKQLIHKQKKRKYL